MTRHALTHLPAAAIPGLCLGSAPALAQSAGSDQAATGPMPAGQSAQSPPLHSPALAQNSSAALDGGASPAADSTGIAKITVTATRKAASAQRVPISMRVLTPDPLQQRDVNKPTRSEHFSLSCDNRFRAADTLVIVDGQRADAVWFGVARAAAELLAAALDQHRNSPHPSMRQARGF